MTFQAGLYTLFMGLLYGSVIMASRFSVGQFQPLTYISIRVLIASLGYLGIIFFQFRRKKLQIKDGLIKKSILLGIFGDAIPMFFFITGVQYISSGVASILNTLYPVVTLVLGHFFLHDEKLNFQKGIGAVIAFGGAALMAGMGESGLGTDSGQALLGYGFTGASVLFGGISIIYARKQMSGYDTLPVTGVRILTSAMVTLPFAILFEGFDLSNVDQTGFIVMLYATFVIFLAYFMGFFIMKKFGAFISTLSTYLTPIVGSIGGWLLLGEELTVVMFSGIALIFLGLVITNLKSRKSVTYIGNIKAG